MRVAVLCDTAVRSVCVCVCWWRWRRCKFSIRRRHTSACGLTQIQLRSGGWWSSSSSSSSCAKRVVLSARFFFFVFMFAVPSQITPSWERSGAHNETDYSISSSSLHMLAQNRLWCVRRGCSYGTGPLPPKTNEKHITRARIYRKNLRHFCKHHYSCRLIIFKISTTLFLFLSFSCFTIFDL